MNYLDIFIACLLVFGFIRGYSKGLVMELASVLALIFGVYGSIKFSDFTFTYFSKNFHEQIKNIDENHLKIASFVFTFLVIIVLISIIGRFATKLLKVVFLGFVNKILGGFFGLFKFILFVSLFLVFLDNLNSSFNLLDPFLLKTSFFYEPVKEIGDKLIGFFNSNKQSINFFN